MQGLGIQVFEVCDPDDLVRNLIYRTMGCRQAVICAFPKEPTLPALCASQHSPRHASCRQHPLECRKWGFKRFQQFPRVTSIGSLPPKTLGKSRGPPQNPAETPQNPRRDPAEPSERPPQSPLRGKFPRRASRRVVPLGW